MRRSTGYATFPGGIRRKRQKTPRWPPNWDRKLDASWTPIARIKDGLHQADAIVRAAMPRVSKIKVRAHQRDRERKGHEIVRAASQEHEMLVWSAVWLLRWLFERADERSMQKEGRRREAPHQDRHDASAGR